MLMNYICNLMKPLIKTSAVQNEQQNNKKSHQDDSPIAKQEKDEFSFGNKASQRNLHNRLPGRR